MRLLPLLLIGLTSGVALAQGSAQPFMVGSRGFGTLQEAVNAIGDGEGRSGSHPAPTANARSRAWGVSPMSRPSRAR